MEVNLLKAFSFFGSKEVWGKLIEVSGGVGVGALVGVVAAVAFTVGICVPAVDVTLAWSNK